LRKYRPPSRQRWTWPSPCGFRSQTMLNLPGSGYAKRSPASFCPVCATFWSRKTGASGSRRRKTLPLHPANRMRPNKARVAGRRRPRLRNAGLYTRSGVAAAHARSARPLPAPRCPATINRGTMQHRGAVLLTGAIGVGAAVFGGRFGYQPTTGLQLMAMVFGLLVLVLVLGWVTVVATQTLRRRPGCGGRLADGGGEFRRMCRGPGCRESDREPTAPC
jgi:hypothetical protein